ncbi:MAG TPA: HEAT repeat domain-containing protein [Tepidisphaeraceae bacterium]|jgi:predicted esterase
MSINYEDNRLDEAMRKGDELLVGSLKSEERKRRGSRTIWGGLFLLVMGVAVAVAMLPWPGGEKQGERHSPAAQALSAAPATRPSEGANLDLKVWAESLSNLSEDNWRKSFSVGNELVNLPPETGWSLLAANWKNIKSESARQQILKAFDFAHHPHLLDVLDLGMNDSAPKVRAWAVGYLGAFAFADFAEDSGAYPSWRGKTKGRGLYEVTRESALAWIERANSARPDQVPSLASAVNANDLRKMPAVQKALVDAGVRELCLKWVTENPKNQKVVRAANDVLLAVPIDETFAREKVLPLIAKDQPAEVRLVGVRCLGRAGGKWALEPLVEVLKEAQRAKDRLLIWDTAQALAAIGDARAIPSMIEVIAADNTYDTVYGVGYFGLGGMTGVKYDEKHDGAWWKAWWEREKKRYPEAVQRMKASAAPSDAQVVRPIFAMADGGEAPIEERQAGGDEKKQYFLIGPMGKKAPAAGYRLLLVLPGGDGSAEFKPFVSNMLPQALNDKYLIAQLVAPRWREDENRIVWPTSKSRDSKAKFTTEQFIDAVVEDVKKDHKLDEKCVLALGWSSGGPAVYAATLRAKTPITGAFVAMSIFKPTDTEGVKNGKGRAFYLLHSPQDFIQMRFPESARQLLTKAGAKVELKTYEGGHGWHGDAFGNIRGGVKWLENNVGKPEATTKPATADR